jgi:hypothetical protein
MTPFAQVFHVARKDLRESRRPFSVYVALVVLATANARSPSPLGVLFATPMFFVVIAGMLLVALLIQADSPVRADAFWATHPLQPLAVLAAKTLLAVVIIVGAPLVGQAFALSANDIHGAELLRLLAASAAIYALWLLLAMVTAAFTRDVKTFVVVLVCVPLVVTVGMTVLFSSGETNVAIGSGGSAWSLVVPRFAGWFGVLGCVALIVQLYAARSLGRFARFAAVPLAACLVLWVFEGFGPTPPDWMRTNGPAMPISVSLRNSDPRALAAGSSLEIDVTTPSVPEGRRLTFVANSIELELRDGTKLRLHMNLPTADFGSARPALAGVTWRTPNADSLPVARLGANLDFAERRAVQNGIVRVSVNGTVLATAPRVAGTVNLARGAWLVNHGQRLRVRSWEFGSGTGSLTLQTWSIRLHDVPPQPFGYSNAIQYALVNDGRHEAIPLNSTGSTGGSSWLVLPGTDAQASSITLENRNFSRSTSEGMPTDDWFRGAHLVVMDWVPVGRYSVSAEGGAP